MDMNAAQPEVDAIARAVGFAISKWGEIESALCSIYVAALRAPVYAVARNAFYSIVSFQAKLRAVDACFRSEFEGEVALLDEWVRFRKAAAKVSQQRNELAHGSVMVVNTKPPIPGWFPYWNGSAIEGTIWIDDHVVVIDQAKFHYYTSAQISEFRSRFESVARQGDRVFRNAAAFLHAAGKSWNQR